MAVLEALARFAEELRRLGLPVSPNELIDAGTALRVVGVERRSEVCCALRSTLVKSSSDLPAFEQAFGMYFGPGPGVVGLGEGLEPDACTSDLEGFSEHEAGIPAPRRSGISGLAPPGKLAALVVGALSSGDAALIAEASRLAVALHGGIEPGRRIGTSYHLYRTLRAIDLDTTLARLIATALAHHVMDETTATAEHFGDHPEHAGSGSFSRVRTGSANDEALARLAGLGALGELLVVEEYRRRGDALREAITEEIRRQLLVGEDASLAARAMLRPLVEDLELMRASQSELEEIRKALAPLARVLATRLARSRRRHGSGAIDVRATIRRSQSNGGVPIEIVTRPPHPRKPELVVLADVSGSVASFAHFTLHLLYAIAGQFQKVRSFVFVDGLDEVSSILAHAPSVARAVEKVMGEARVLAGAGHSDLGAALELFSERYAGSVSKRSVVLVLGDARNNYHDPRTDLLEKVHRASKSLHWLNPEPRAYWDSGDSAIGAYAPFCDTVVECRSLRQLAAFVGGLA